MTSRTCFTPDVLYFGPISKELYSCKNSLHELVKNFSLFQGVFLPFFGTDLASRIENP